MTDRPCTTSRPWALSPRSRPQHRAARVGLALMLGSAQADWRTQADRVIRSGLEPLLDASRLREQMEDEFLVKLLAELPDKTAIRVRNELFNRRQLREADQAARRQVPRVQGHHGRGHQPGRRSAG